MSTSWVEFRVLRKMMLIAPPTAMTVSCAFLRCKYPAVKVRAFSSVGLSISWVVDGIGNPWESVRFLGIWMETSAGAPMFGGARSWASFSSLDIPQPMATPFLVALCALRVTKPLVMYFARGQRIRQPAPSLLLNKSLNKPRPEVLKCLTNRQSTRFQLPLDRDIGEGKGRKGKHTG